MRKKRELKRRIESITEPNKYPPASLCEILSADSIEETDRDELIRLDGTVYHNPSVNLEGKYP